MRLCRFSKTLVPGWVSLHICAFIATHGENVHNIDLHKGRVAYKLTSNILDCGPGVKPIIDAFIVYSSQ